MTDMNTTSIPDHIHVPLARWPADVYVDGVMVKKAFYADTKEGFVRYRLSPSRLNRRCNDLRWAKKRGTVTVVYQSTIKHLALGWMRWLLSIVYPSYNRISRGPGISMSPIYNEDSTIVGIRVFRHSKHVEDRMWPHSIAANGPT